MSAFKPNLAARIEDLTTVKLPVYGSAKLDGIRCIIRDGCALTRSLKPIPNVAMNRLLSDPLFNDLDGEIIVGPPNATDVFLRTTSAVRKFDSENAFTFFVFDMVGVSPYDMRLAAMQKVFGDWLGNVPTSLLRVEVLKQTKLETLTDILQFEQEMIDAGYEGICLRSPYGQYKFGRSTMKEQGLMKLKRFTDAEAEVIGFEEQMYNANDSFRDELGRLKRSSSMEGLVGKDTLGALVCRTPDGIQFNIGTGMDDKTRKHIWDHRPEFIGKMVRYRFFNVGVKTAPRHPIYSEFREPFDMD